MANIKSAQKRILVNTKKHDRNRTVISKVKTAIKKYNNAIDTNNIEEAEKMLPEVFGIIDRAAAYGAIHKNNAANKKSQLSKKLSDVKSGKLVITIKKDNKTVAAEKAKAAQEARDKARAEYEKAAAERKAVKIEAEKAKLAAQAEATKKQPKKAAKEKEAPVKEAPAKAAKAAKEEKAEPKAKKAPAPKKAKEEKTEAEPKAE